MTDNRHNSLAERVLKMKKFRENHPADDGEPAGDSSPTEAQCQCGGRTVWIRYDQRGGHFQPCARCQTPPVVIENLNQAGIPDKFKLANFSASNLFHATEHQEQAGAARFSDNEERVMQFTEAAGRFLKQGVTAGDRFFLTLMGPVGTGKTHLAVAALKDIIIRQRCAGRFVDFQTLLHEIKDTYTRNDSEEDIMRPLRHIPVLVVDEFGKGRTESEWEREKLDDIVNSRYNLGRITIITTNYLPADRMHDPLMAFLKERAALQERLRGMVADKNKEREKEARNYLMSAFSEETQRLQRSETFFTQSLSDRIGMRMYDRLLEVSQFVDFTGIHSFRRRAADAFLKRLAASEGE